LDYQGVLVEQAQGGMMVLPKMNLILEAETAISLTELFAAIPEDLKVGDHTIQLGNLKYEVVQLDAKTLFIGIDPNSIIRQKQTDLVSVKGSFKPLLVIEGSRLVTTFMDVIPAVGAGKRFTKAAKDVRISATQKGSTISLKGTINFNSDAYALHELFKLLLAFDPFQ
jgi:hypothetical protein